MIKVLAFCSLTLMSASLFAQKLFVGPELGMNLIQVQEQEIGNNYQPGWYGGAAVDYQFNDWLSIRTGAYFSQGRHSYSSEDTSAFELLGGFIDTSSLIPGLDMNTYTSIEGRQSLYYIQVPIQANFSWNNIQLFLGGYAGFMVGAKQKESITERTPFMSIIDIESLDPTGGLLSAFLPAAYEESFDESSETSDYKVFDYGLKGGLGYQMDRFGVQASYSFGLSDFRIDAEDDVKRNQYFQFSVRYMLPIGKSGGSSSIH